MDYSFLIINRKQELDFLKDPHLKRGTRSTTDTKSNKVLYTLQTEKKLTKFKWDRITI